jgi:hypothetical protein
MQQKQKLSIAFLAVLMLVLGGFAVYQLTSPAPQKTATHATNKTITPATHYDNFQALLDSGVSSEQLVSVESSTATYVKSLGHPVKTVSVDTDSIHHLAKNPDSTVDTLEYTISIDGKLYTSHLNYIGIDAIQLLILDDSGAQVYDSGVLEDS